MACLNSSQLRSLFYITILSFNFLIYTNGSRCEDLEALTSLTFSDPQHNSLKPFQTLKGPTQMETTKFQHYYKGLEVIGSIVFQHKNKGKLSIRNKITQFDLDTRPTLNEEEIAQLAQGIIGNLRLRRPPTLKILPSPLSDQQGSAKLIYWIEMTGKGQGEDRDILIDAHTGALIADLSHYFTLAPIQIYSAKNQGIEIFPKGSHIESNEEETFENCELVQLSDKKSLTISAQTCKSVYNGTSHYTDGQCQIIDGKRGFPLGIDKTSCVPVAFDQSILDLSDPAAARALSNSQKVLKYFQDRFGRNSFDDQGSQLVSLIHAGDQMSNAFWNVNSNMMVYGEGDGKVFKDFTQSPTVAGHEMTHGIIAHTANLIPMGESGALNEAFADFFAKQIENEGNWLMGKDLFLPTSGRRGLRDLANPGSIQESIDDGQGHQVLKPHPSTREEAILMADEQACDKINDNCWIHFNSTVPGHASYLIDQAIGSSKAELLYYIALTQNISANDDFKSAAKAIIQTCEHLEFSESDCNLVRTAFKQVQMI